MGRRSRPKSKPMGAKLKLIRQHFGLSQTRMLTAVRPNLDPENRAVISQYEKGITDPDYPTLLSYARHARLSTDVLIDDERELTPEMIRLPPARTAPPKLSGANKSRSPGKNVSPAKEVQKMTAAQANRSPGELFNTPSSDSLDISPADVDYAAAAAAEKLENDGREAVRATERAETAGAKAAEGETQNAEIDDAEIGDAEIRGGEVEEYAAPPTPARTVTNDAAATVVAEESQNEMTGNAQERKPEQPERRLKDRLLETVDHDLERFSTRLPRLLLDRLDDLFLKHSFDVPRRSRRRLKRRHFYHALLAAALTAADEDSLPQLAPIWEEIVGEIERRADDSPNLSSTD